MDYKTTLKHIKNKLHEESISFAYSSLLLFLSESLENNERVTTNQLNLHILDYKM